jgi:hypothetical protein
VAGNLLDRRAPGDREPAKIVRLNTEGEQQGSGRESQCVIRLTPG